MLFALLTLPAEVAIDRAGEGLADAGEERLVPSIFRRSVKDRTNVSWSCRGCGCEGRTTAVGVAMSRESDRQKLSVGGILTSLTTMAAFSSPMVV